jgi:hypothetical protein
MSPVHLAAINPYKKGKVLDQMLLLDGSTVSKEDGHRRQPIHFAAGDLYSTHYLYCYKTNL